MRSAVATPGETLISDRHITTSARRAYATTLAGAVTLAIGLRLLFWWMQARTGAVQPGDSEEYVRGAVGLLHSAYTTGEKWLRPPLYPFFLAAAFATAGYDIPRALLLQALVTGAGVLAFAGLGHALFGRKDVAVVSALIAALFIPFVAYGSVLFAEALFVVLVTASFALLLRRDRAGRRRAALAGIVFGLATLTRAVGLFFLPFAMLALVVEMRETSLVHGRSFRASRWGGTRSGIGAAVAFGLATVLTIAPWTVRNALAYGRFIPVDTNGGVSFWYGAVRDDAELERGEALLAGLPNLADKQRAAVRMALDTIRDEPVRYLGRVRFKIVSLWQLGSRNYAAGGIVSLDPGGRSLGVTPGELPLPLSVLADLQYVLLVLGAIWGYSYAPRESRSLVLLGWVLFGTAMSGLTIGHPRLRLPLLAVFVPYTAWALLNVRALAARAVRRPRGVAALAAGLSLLFGAVIYTQHYARFARAQLAVWRGSNANPETFRHAYELNPANPLWLMAAGDREAGADRPAAAEQEYARAAQQEPRSLYAHAKLIESALLRGDPADADAHLDEIRRLGRDNNDLLAWAWSRLRANPPAVLQPAGAAALGNIEGWAPAHGGDDERWTLGTARLRLATPEDCGTLVLMLRGRQAGQRVDVEAGGRRTRLSVTDARARYAVPLPSDACRAGEPLVVSLRTGPGFVDQPEQPWPVGVAVASAAVE